MDGLELASASDDIYIMSSNDTIPTYLALPLFTRPNKYAVAYKHFSTTVVITITDYILDKLRYIPVVDYEEKKRKIA